MIYVQCWCSTLMQEVMYLLSSKVRVFFKFSTLLSLHVVLWQLLIMFNGHVWQWSYFPMTPCSSLIGGPLQTKDNLKPKEVWGGHTGTMFSATAGCRGIYVEVEVVDVCVEHQFCPVQAQSDLMATEELHWSSIGFRALLKGTSMVVMRENKCCSFSFPIVVYPACLEFEPATL